MFQKMLSWMILSQGSYMTAQARAEKHDWAVNMLFKANSQARLCHLQ